jgi:hypothetical protein
MKAKTTFDGSQAVPTQNALGRDTFRLLCNKCVNIAEQIPLEKDPHNETLSHFQKHAAALFATNPTATEIYDTPLYNQTVIPPHGLPANMQFLANLIWSPSSNNFETSVNFPSDVTWALKFSAFTMPWTVQRPAANCRTK